MFELSRFQGVFVAFYGCYDCNGEVSPEAAQKLARFYRDLGVSGLYLNGSSGEGFLMNVEERKKITEAVCEAVKEDLTVIVHVGAAATRDSVELAIHAEKCGAHALSAVPSVYYQLSNTEIINHWTKITESSTLPFLAYNIPQLTGHTLTPTLIKELVKNPKIIGVKNSSMSAYQIEQFKRAGGKDFVVINGPDEQFVAGRVMGAQAGIGGTYGVMPELFLYANECVKKGDMKAALEVQIRINECIEVLCGFGSMYAAAKEILKLRGVDIGIVRLPMMPIREDQMDGIRALYKKIMESIKEFTGK